LISNYDYLYGGYRIKTGHTSKKKREAENIEKGIKRLPARRYNAFGSRIMNRKKKQPAKHYSLKNPSPSYKLIGVAAPIPKPRDFPVGVVMPRRAEAGVGVICPFNRVGELFL
jgi:hypothetical protein